MVPCPAMTCSSSYGWIKVHDHGIHIRQLVQDLQANGALPGNDLLVVVRVDKGHAGLSLQFHCLVVGVVVGAGYQADLCAQVLGVFYLHQRGAVRHADTSAPRFLVFSTFIKGAPSGMQTMLLMPRRVAASATPWA